MTIPEYHRRQYLPSLSTEWYLNLIVRMQIDMNYEPVVNQFFEKLGYKVEKIPETNDKTPDFKISDATYSYILELKTKFPSIKEIERRKSVLDSGKIHTDQEIIIGKNTLSGIIKTAKDQINSLLEENAFKIVWLLTTGHLAEPRLLQYEATLYGITTVVSSKRACDCYFFCNSDFYRFQEFLDGAIVSTKSKAKFLLNPLSPRYEQIKGS